MWELFCDIKDHDTHAHELNHHQCNLCVCFCKYDTKANCDTALNVTDLHKNLQHYAPEQGRTQTLSVEFKSVYLLTLSWLKLDQRLTGVGRPQGGHKVMGMNTS